MSKAVTQREPYTVPCPAGLATTLWKATIDAAPRSQVRIFRTAAALWWSCEPGLWTALTAQLCRAVTGTGKLTPGAAHLPVSRMRSGCRGTQESGVARSRLSTSVTGSCSAHSAVPGSSGSSDGEPSRRRPASAGGVTCTWLVPALPGKTPLAPASPPAGKRPGTGLQKRYTSPLTSAVRFSVTCAPRAQDLDYTSCFTCR